MNEEQETSIEPIKMTLEKPKKANVSAQDEEKVPEKSKKGEKLVKGQAVEEAVMKARQELLQQGIDWKTGDALHKDHSSPQKEFTDEELAICKRTPLLPLVQQLGYQPYHVGQYYALRGRVEMTSMRINPRKNTWTRYADDRGGSATDLVMYLEDMTFQEAVRFLLDYNNVPHEARTYTPSAKSYRHLNYRWYQVEQTDGKIKVQLAAEKIVEVAEAKQQEQVFVLPNANRDYNRVYAYLIQKRKLSKDVVDFFVRQRLIYESVKTHNAVFVGRDETGKIRHAILRGTYDREGKEAFKGMVSSSKPEYAFHLITDSPRLIVTEAPLDCMSYMQMEENVKDKGLSCYLALGGRHDRALEWFLKTYPHIKEIYLGTDLDEAGQEAYENMKEKYTTGEWKGRYKVKRIAAYGFKDWNEMLQWQSRMKLEDICRNEWEANGSLSENSLNMLERDNLVFDQDMGVHGRSETAKLPFEEKDHVETLPAGLSLPAAYHNHYRIFQYFCNEKKMPEELIQYLIDKKLLYESAEDHSAVFVCRDKDGIIRYAMSCSTKTDGEYEVIAGSDPEYTFCMTNSSSRFKRVEVFEDVVDALAGVSLFANIVSYDVSAFDYKAMLENDYFVMRDGNEKALDKYLREHPDIKHIEFHFGNARSEALNNLKEKYSSGEWMERKFGILESGFEDFSSQSVREMENFHQSFISLLEAQTEAFCEDEIKKTGCLSEASKERLTKLGWHFDAESKAIRKPQEITQTAEAVSLH